MWEDMFTATFKKSYSNVAGNDMDISIGSNEVKGNVVQTSPCCTKMFMGAGENLLEVLDFSL